MNVEKWTMFIEENTDIAMKYILWEQEFYVEQNDIDLRRCPNN